MLDETRLMLVLKDSLSLSLSLSLNTELLSKLKPKKS